MKYTWQAPGFLILPVADSAGHSNKDFCLNISRDGRSIDCLVMRQPFLYLIKECGLLGKDLPGTEVMRSGKSCVAHVFVMAQLL
jgi:hypothetical protein